MDISSSHSTDLEAFCRVCPDPGEVAQAMLKLGFQLNFQMNAVDSKIIGIASLPAQYHYSYRDCEVVFLAGKDQSESGLPALPEHASRWWIYAGIDAGLTRRVALALSALWLLTWHAPVTALHALPQSA